MSVMKRLDAFLMERVFQPTVDRMEGRATPADAARFFLTGAMVLLFARMLASAAVALPTWAVLFDFAALWGSMAMMRAVGMGAAAGRGNPLRDQLGLARPTVAFITVLIWAMGSTSLAESLAAMQLTLWSAALYFASCNPPAAFRPRQPRRRGLAAARAVPLG
jgi:hypothetical protein